MSGKSKNLEHERNQSKSRLKPDLDGTYTPLGDFGLYLKGSDLDTFAEIFLVTL